MGEYIPRAPINDEARKRNQNLSGMGGIFNLVKMHVYQVVGNKPVKANRLLENNINLNEDLREFPSSNKSGITIKPTDADNKYHDSDKNKYLSPDGHRESIRDKITGDEELRDEFKASFNFFPFYSGSGL